MRRFVLALALTGMVATAVHAGTQATYLGFQTGITKAPRHAPFFKDSPHCGLVKNTRIFYVDGKYFEHDAFSYESVWYVYCNSYWYRARSFHGPFASIEVHEVPRPILEVHPIYWKHHPTGLLANGKRPDPTLPSKFAGKVKTDKKAKPSAGSSAPAGKVAGLSAGKERAATQHAKPETKKKVAKDEKTKLAKIDRKGTTNVQSSDRHDRRNAARSNDGVLARNR